MDTAGAGPVPDPALQARRVTGSATRPKTWVNMIPV